MARTRRYHPLVADDLAAAAKYYDDTPLTSAIVFGPPFANALERSPSVLVHLVESMGRFALLWLADSRT